MSISGAPPPPWLAEGRRLFIGYDRPSSEPGRYTEDADIVGSGADAVAAARESLVFLFDRRGDFKQFEDD